MRPREGEQVACRRWLTDGDERIRRRTPPEVEACLPCAWGCDGVEACERDDPPDPDAMAIVGTWLACGGRQRRLLPRAGGVLDQDAADAFWLRVIDVVVREEDSRAARERAKRNDQG